MTKERAGLVREESDPSGLYVRLVRSVNASGARRGPGEYPAKATLKFFASASYADVMDKEKIDVKVPIPIEPKAAYSALTQMLLSGTHPFSIRLPLGDYLPGDFTLQKEVALSVHFMRDEANLNNELRVFFKATTSPELFPQFNGTIDVGADDSAGVLHLYGSYDPPLGKIGQIFDAAIGRRIAQQCTKELLIDIRERLLQHLNYSEI